MLEGEYIIFYVYLYIIIDTDEIFYVGKGKGNRAWTGKRNKFCEDMKNTHDWKVVILKDNLSEREAFDLEIESIAKYKNCHRLTNQTVGGDGASGYKMTSEQKARISESSKLKWQDKDFRNKQIYNRQYGVYQSPEFRKKLSLVTKGELNGNYGNKWTDEQKKIASAKMKGRYDNANNPRATKIQCVETGQIFNCIKEATEFLGLKSQASLTIALNKPNRTARGLHWTRI